MITTASVHFDCQTQLIQRGARTSVFPLEPGSDSRRFLKLRPRE